MWDINPFLKSAGRLLTYIFMCKSVVKNLPLDDDVLSGTSLLFMDLDITTGSLHFGTTDGRNVIFSPPQYSFFLSVSLTHTHKRSFCRLHYTLLCSSCLYNTWNCEEERDLTRHFCLWFHYWNYLQSRRSVSFCLMFSIICFEKQAGCTALCCKWEQVSDRPRYHRYGSQDLSSAWWCTS